jgi:hypothetical protein
MDYEVQLSEPDPIHDAKMYVEHALGNDLGWDHPVSRVCVAMTQSVMAVASSTVILAVSDFNNKMPLTDGAWKIEIAVDEGDKDVVWVKHKRTQMGQSFTIGWSMDMMMRGDRHQNSIVLEEATLNIIEEDCTFAGNEQKEVILQILKDAV